MGNTFQTRRVKWRCHQLMSQHLIQRLSMQGTIQSVPIYPQLLSTHILKNQPKCDPRIHPALSGNDRPQAHRHQEKYPCRDWTTGGCLPKVIYLGFQADLISLSILDERLAMCLLSSWNTDLRNVGRLHLEFLTHSLGNRIVTFTENILWR